MTPRQPVKPRTTDNPERTRATHEAVEAWLREGPGAALAAAEQEVYDAIVPDLFGYHLLQIGRLGGADLAGGSRILHRVQLEVGHSRDAAGNVSALLGEADSLPFASDTVDVVLLPHVLEFEPRPHDALRETFRVLAPEGHLMLSVFNPTSMLGIWRLARRRQRRAAPWNGQFLTLPRLRDWLVLLGFDVRVAHARFFAPPFRNARVLGRLLRADRQLSSVCPILAGTHVVLARKRVFTLTPLRPRWATRKRLVAGGLAEPTARRFGND